MAYPAPTYRTHEEIAVHGFDFRPSWWSRHVGQPSWTKFLDDLPEAERGRGYRHITRADLWGASGVASSEPLVLVAVYAWGTGEYGFLVPRRTKVFRDNSEGSIREGLARARTRLANDGPASAYASLSRGGQNWLKYLGSSFITKYLYAIDPRRSEPGGALMLDRFVAIALNEFEHWGLKERGPWSAAEYQRWLDYAHNRARLSSEATGRQVRADAVEIYFFECGRRIAKER